MFCGPARSFDVTVVSPHQDDAAFSLALTLFRLAQASVRIRILNCFTHSDYAPFGADGDAERVTASRAIEDRACYQAIHQAIDVVDLGLQDAPLRLGCAPDQVCDGRAFTDDDREAAATIGAALPEQGWILAPLAFESHIDHRVASTAGMDGAAAQRGFYEDLPYAMRVGEPGIKIAVTSLSERLGRGLEPLLIEGAPGPKRAWIDAYRTQASPSELDAVAGYTKVLRGERIWLPAPVAPFWSVLP